MNECYTVKPIAHIQSQFPTKFGIPRQSGVVKEAKARIIFVPEWRNSEALRGMEQFSHLWLLWRFSDITQEQAAATVRPPRLGGNTRVGVFASRSPFRPNQIGLSAVQLLSVDYETPCLWVGGADLMDGTPILDIKPYLPYVDSYPSAANGFADTDTAGRLHVQIPRPLEEKLAPDTAKVLRAVLAQDPRPAYQQDAQRVYGMPFEKWEIRFTVQGDTLSVCDIIST